MAEKDLSALFLNTLKDIYYAEKQIYKSLPKMAKAANSDQLRAASKNIMTKPKDRSSVWSRSSNFWANRRAARNATPSKASTRARRSWTNTRASQRSMPACSPPRRAVEHYEISRYGTLKTWASKLNLKDAVKLLDQTLAEEKKTDDALTKLADTAVNAEAA